MNISFFFIHIIIPSIMFAWSCNNERSHVAIDGLLLGGGGGGGGAVGEDLLIGYPKIWSS